MHSASSEQVIVNRRVALRVGSVDDIDLLSDIDVDAALLFERANLARRLPADSELAAADRARWLHCLAAGSVLIAVDPCEGDVGFAALGNLDGEPYLVQLSVRLRAMRRGIGTQLLTNVGSLARQAGGHALWLITYNHLRWNRPFYERRGFAIVSPGKCGSDINTELLHQRRCLALPEERIIMCKQLRPTAS